MEDVSTCTVDGCGNKLRTKTLCSTHYKLRINASRKCRVEECQGPVIESGYCRPHAKKAARGTLDGLPEPRAAKDRFEERISRHENGCWIWTGALDEYGYGAFSPGGTIGHIKAHRYAWYIEHGVMPGDVIDHLCHEPDSDCPGGTTCLHRRCVNPAHLVQTTNAENVRRGNGPSGLNARKTHCIRGHEFDSENTRITRKGHRDCRACQRDRGRRSRAA